MTTRTPSYENLFKILNRRIADSVKSSDTEQARKQIEILERLVKLEKSFMEFTERAKNHPYLKNKADTKVEKERLFKELEERLMKIRQANQQVDNLK